MRRLKYTIEMDVMADDDNQLYRAHDQLVLVGDFLSSIPAGVLGALPTGTITGRAPAAADRPGWMAVIKIEEKED